MSIKRTAALVMLGYMELLGQLMRMMLFPLVVTYYTLKAGWDLSHEDFRDALKYVMEDKDGEEENGDNDA
jgi:hypothetical protein